MDRAAEMPSMAYKIQWPTGFASTATPDRNAARHVSSIRSSIKARSIVFSSDLTIMFLFCSMSSHLHFQMPIGSVTLKSQRSEIVLMTEEPECRFHAL